MSPQVGWVLQEEVVPRLKSAIPYTVNFVGSEDAQELVQDSIALAARMMHNNELAGKKVTPGNVAYYTIRHVKSGRRSTGSSVADVMATGTQLNGRTRLHSLEDVVASDEASGGEIFLLHDVLSNNQEDPFTQAARKLDWEGFVASLSERERQMVEFVAEGMTVRDVGRKLNICDSVIYAAKRNLALKLLEFMGCDILIQVQRSPEWKINLEANKEKMACRHERTH